MLIYMYVSFTYVLVYRRLPMDVTLCGQISNNPTSTIQPISNGKVEIYFSIENINVSQFSYKRK